MNQKVAYITGGSKGIGLGVARALLEDGYRVAISARSEKSLNEAQILLQDAKGELLGIVSNVQSLADELNAIQAVLDHWGQLDICIANAGVGKFASIEDITKSDWDLVIDTNLTGVFHTVKACIDPIKESKGYIITIASLAGANFFAKGAAYNASKFGLVGFTQAIMLDLRKYGVKVSTIMPGSVATYFNDRTPTEADDWKIQPEDIG
ncbi:MAG: SDR family oxidoreductase, partial [Bacteroidia bacterium]|nr:SDR family oxidoreductase [Bacteroidia bacterium]